MGLTPDRKPYARVLNTPHPSVPSDTNTTLPLPLNRKALKKPQSPKLLGVSDSGLNHQKLLNPKQSGANRAQRSGTERSGMSGLPNTASVRTVLSPWPRNASWQPVAQVSVCVCVCVCMCAEHLSKGSKGVVQGVASFAAGARVAVITLLPYALPLQVSPRKSPRKSIPYPSRSTQAKKDTQQRCAVVWQGRLEFPLCRFVSLSDSIPGARYSFAHDISMIGIRFQYMLLLLSLFR